ncbi:mitochondrial ribosome-associated GTPase 1-like [Watersipora subatra]|uniref:mitochondrial ribosome-associated GTPase 1-like n=1 Tax=Watersipora subatra TaxID=2589382 RepID=UPI00355BC937
MRKVFPFPHYDMATWFPGHMFKGLQKMQQKIGDMDCVIEVHDARIPFSGRNPLFSRHAKMRPHILVLSKIDMVDSKSLRWLRANSDKLSCNAVIFADMNNKTDVAAHQILDETMQVLENSDRYAHRIKEDAFNLLIMGIPNVGKSSLINFLRNSTLRKKGKSTRVGASPGVTRAVLEKIRISDEPPMFLYDTPGIVSPRVESADVALKLAACNTVKSSVIGEEMICDFILYHLNKNNILRYVKLYGMEQPSDEILEVLRAIAVREDKFTKHTIAGQYQMLPNFKFACDRMLKDFNHGKLGSLNFDRELIFGEPQEPNSI